MKPNTLVVIQPSQEGAGLSIALINSEQPSRASLYIQDKTHIVIAPHTDQTKLLASCDMEIVLFGEEQLELELVQDKVSNNLFRSGFEIGEIDFTNLRDEPEVPIRIVSKIKSGTLFIEKLQGQTYQLRKGEILNFDIDRMQVRSLMLKDNSLHLELDGVVNTLNLGSKNLMPRWLQYWHSQNEWSLFWATATAALTVLIGVLRWLRIT